MAKVFFENARVRKIITSCPYFEGIHLKVEPQKVPIFY